MLAFVTLALAFTVALTLGTDVVAEHGSKDKVLFWSQFIQRTGDEQTDGIETLLATEIDVDILLACGLHHVVDGLAAQSIRGKSLETAVAGEEYHPAHTFLIFVDVIHQHPGLRPSCFTLERVDASITLLSLTQHLHGGGHCLTCHLSFYRLLHIPDILEVWRNLGYPRIDTSIRLVILVHIVERQTHELTIHDSLRVIKGITVGADSTHETGTAFLDTIIQLADATYKGVAIRLTVATAEEGDGLVG